MLAEHALRLTPPELGGAERAPARARRIPRDRPASARRVTDLLTPELDSLPRARPRSRLAAARRGRRRARASTSIERHLESRAGRVREGDPALRAHVLAKKSITPPPAAVWRIREAEAVGRWRRCGTRPGRSRRWSGSRCSDWLGARDARAADRRRLRALPRRIGRRRSHRRSPERVAGQRLLWRGDVTEARATFTRLPDARRRAGREDLLRPPAAAPVRARAARRRVGRGIAPARRVGRVRGRRVAGLADVRAVPSAARGGSRLPGGGGAMGGRRRRATPRRAAAAGTGSRRCGRVGIAALLARDPERAAESLRLVWEHTRREGVDEPGVFPGRAGPRRGAGRARRARRRRGRGHASA